MPREPITIGYARSFPDDSGLAAQVGALKRARAKQVFAETLKAPGPQLEAAIDALRCDDTLVVTRASRIARSLIELCSVLGVLEEKGVLFVCLEQPDFNMDWGRETRIKVGFLRELARLGDDVIEEARLAGIKRAAAQGKYKENAGRPRKYERAVLAPRIKELRALGQSPKNIAKSLRIALSTLYEICPTERVKQNPAPARKKRKPARKRNQRAPSHSA